MIASRLAIAHVLETARRRGAHPVADGRRDAPSAAVAPPRLTYVICTLPRSGSWLLSEGLGSTSVAGNPREWFNTIQEQHERAQWRLNHPSDLSFANYLSLVRSRGTTRNGICGIKLHYYQFTDLAKKLASVPGLRDLTLADRMSRVFPNVRYVWLTRRDKARQAISYYLASSTQTWWVIDGAPQSPPENDPPEPVYDPHAIARLERVLLGHESRWKAFFEDNGLEPLVVHYEDVLADYEGQIHRVLTWLGIADANDVPVPPTRLKRQSTGRNDDWLSRYQAFKAQSASAATKEPSPPAAAAEALTARAERAFEAIPYAWQQWIAQQKSSKTADDAIVDVLVRNGYDRALAVAEVEKASTDPYLRSAIAYQRQNGKAVSLLNALGQLRKLDSRAQTIDRRANLSSADFRDQYYAANRPVILQGLMSDWRAPTAWTPEYLKRTVGGETVEIMADRNADPRYELNAARHRKPITFAEYVDRVHSGAITNDYNLVANNGFFQRPATQVLLEDIVPLPPYLKPVPAGQQCFLWFGPAGTVTPLHHDTSNILVAQVVGRKRFRMIPAAQWQYVYNHVGVFSEVDLDSPDLERYPLFRNATILDVVLLPGEMLFVPVGWWHHVVALDVSMTVSFTHFAYPNHFTWEPRT